MEYKPKLWKVPSDVSRPKAGGGGGQRSQLEGSLSVLLQGDVREASAKIDVFVFCRVS
jgi:hypothetical protein